MKIKKFNVAVAGVVLAVTVSITGFVGSTLIGHETTSPVSGVSGMEVVERVAGDLTYSQEQQEITVIDWTSEHGRMPGNVKLVKWTEGDRVYYQMTGPVNERSIGNEQFHYSKRNWGKTTEMEVFFPRDGDHYDQWLINPDNAQILHWTSPNKYSATSDLPSSRYVCEIKDGKLVTTFWCHKSDTPGNIVFNYNNGGGKNSRESLSWKTTGKKGKNWNHHLPSRWTNP